MLKNTTVCLTKPNIPVYQLHYSSQFKVLLNVHIWITHLIKRWLYHNLTCSGYFVFQSSCFGLAAIINTYPWSCGSRNLELEPWRIQGTCLKVTSIPSHNGLESISVLLTQLISTANDRKILHILYKYKHGQFHERTDEKQKQPHLDDEDLPTSVFKEGSLYMQFLHSSVNCLHIHFAQTLW